MLNREFHRPHSACRLREKTNPILPHEHPVVIEKPGKAQVEQSFFYSKYPAERPKGKSRNDISVKSNGTFCVNRDQPQPHRPCIRVNIQQVPSNYYERPQSIRVVGYDQTKQPVIEERPASRPRNRGSPSPILKYTNERKYCLPADLGMRSGQWGFNKSTVFEDGGTSYLFNGKNKTLLGKDPEIRNVMEYEYALPYREQKVTPKP